MLMKFSAQVGHSTNSNIRSQLHFNLAKHLCVKATKSSIRVGTMHPLSSNCTNTIASLALTAWLLFQYGVGLGYYSNWWHQSRALSFGPTNYKQCLHLSEWVSEWVTHLHIESPQETSFYASRIHEFKKDLKEPGLVKLLGKAILHTVLQSISVKRRLQTADRGQNADWGQNADRRLQTRSKMQTEGKIKSQ